jgi:hypothetical protein
MTPEKDRPSRPAAGGSREIDHAGEQTGCSDTKLGATWRDETWPRAKLRLDQALEVTRLGTQQLHAIEAVAASVVPSIRERIVTKDAAVANLLMMALDRGITHANGQDAVAACPPRSHFRQGRDVACPSLHWQNSASDAWWSCRLRNGVSNRRTAGPAPSRH